MLSPRLLEILTPLFCELEELGRQDAEGGTLDLDEFVDAVSRLYDQVAHPDKHILMNSVA